MDYPDDADDQSVDIMRVVDRLPPDWRQVVYDYGFTKAMEKLNQGLSAYGAAQALAADLTAADAWKNKR